jgi:hypothetical protein
LNPEQNQPMNQMGILLAGGAYETLQCKDEQIWPWIIQEHLKVNKGYPWMKSVLCSALQQNIYNNHNVTCSIKLRTAKAGLGKPWAEVALWTPPEIGVLKSPALVPPPEPLPPGVVIVDHDIPVCIGSCKSSLSLLSEWLKFSFRITKIHPSKPLKCQWQTLFDHHL